MSRTLAALCLLALAVSSLTAQQNPLVGRWKVRYVGGMRMGPDGTSAIQATGTLTIEAQGDSLIGTLVNDPSPDMPARPPARMAGLAQAGQVTLVARSTATLSMNGEQREATAVSTWVLGATGDSLQGTVERHLEGFDMPSPGSQPVTGSRIAG